MLPDNWQDWKTCTNDILYVRLGLNPEEANSYSNQQIEAGYRERRAWWSKKPRHDQVWAERILEAETGLVEARGILTNDQKRAEYDRQLEEGRKKKEKEEREKKIKDFLELLVYPSIKNGILTREDEEIIIGVARKELGLSKTEYEKLIEDALKKFGARRGEEEEVTKPSIDPVALFKDNVYSVLTNGRIGPGETRHLLKMALKHNILWMDAKRIINECVREKAKEQGPVTESNLPPETISKSYKDVYDQYDQVILECTNNIDTLYTRCARAYSNRGDAYAKKGGYYQAILDYNKAIEMKPGYAEAYRGKAIVLEMTGNKNEAVAEYRRFIQYASPDEASLVLDTRIKIERMLNEIRRKEYLGG
jgi:tetratricopeptide (TPR) repeat protein